jgi:hypothetical protein
LRNDITRQENRFRDARTHRQNMTEKMDKLSRDKMSKQRQLDIMIQQAKARAAHQAQAQALARRRGHGMRRRGG